MQLSLCYTDLNNSSIKSVVRWMPLKGHMEYISVEGRSCICFVPDGAVRHLAVLCGWNMENLMPALGEELAETLLISVPADGSRDFTPWPAPAVWENEPFYGEGQAYRQYLTESVLPRIFEKFGFIPAEDRLIAGYSLGGLFALWTACSSKGFGLAASLSGSVWYPGFIEYVRENPPANKTKLYLSLGDREPFGGPPALRKVGVCTEALHAFLQEEGFETMLEWNRGGHGKGIENRWRKALRWAARYWKGSSHETANII